MALNLYERFRETARSQPDRPAVLAPNAEVMTYADLNEAVQSAARQLRHAGVRAGDCVGLHLPTGASYITANYAVWSCGACIVPIPMELRPTEKQEIPCAIALDWIISAPDPSSTFESLRSGEATPLAAGVTVMPITRLREHPSEFGSVNAAFIRFTSGTTGDAKGVVLSHETIHERIVAANEVLRIGPDDRVVWLLSRSYHFAVSIVAYLTFGAGIIMPGNNLAPTILQAARRHGGTLIYGSPIHYQWLAGVEEAASLTRLRLA